MKSTMIRLPEDATMDQVLEAVDALNNDETVDGFLVQLPLPGHLDEKLVTDRIDPSKGCRWLASNQPRSLACWN